MSTRGVKFLFSPGELVLCFEPDPTKARVLYNAKVIETCVGKTECGRRAPEYLIHFNGWNNSWDRIVPEEMVLKATEENKLLMRRLQEIARKVSKKSRKRKIDAILLEVLNRSPYMTAEEIESINNEILSETEDEFENGDGDENFMNGLGDSETTEDNDFDYDASDEDDKNITEITLNIPEVLKKTLESDYYRINAGNKLVKLPAEPNIITILEGYVKNFAINIFCSGTGHRQHHGDKHLVLPEKNIEMCKEVVDGLRIIFDFILAKNLLYKAEKVQYEYLLKTFQPVLTETEKETEPEEIKEAEKPKRKRGRRKKKPPLPVKKIKQEIISEESTSDSEEEPAPRRVTRSLSVNEQTKQTELHNGHTGAKKLTRQQSNEKVKSKDVSNNKTPGARTTRARSRLHSNQSSPPNNYEHSDDTCKKEQEEGNSSSSTNLDNKPSSNPQSVQSGSVLSGSKSSNITPTQNVNDILSWRLLPRDVYCQTPPVPTVTYGAQHLLRLFLKLPNYVMQMQMPERKRSALTKHLDLILEYLANRNDEFFPMTAYIESDELLEGS